MKASELIDKLKTLVEKHGDLELFHEDNSCQGYTFSDAKYDEVEKEIRVY